jgi:predicted alpha-1,2-mannosidase
MPATGFDPANAGPRKHGARFSHDHEGAAPGYYAVMLGTGVFVELTATARVAVHRYTFPAGAAQQVVFVDAGHEIADDHPMADAEVVVDAAAREVHGFSHVSGGYSRRFGGSRLYFVVRFDRAPTTSSTYVGGAVGAAMQARGQDAGAVLRFDASSNAVVAHVGLSFVDVEHARANLAAEAAPFDDVRRATAAAWEERLAALQIVARSDQDRRIAYTALYHTSMMPTLASDVDGSYRGIDGQVHRADGFRYFTDFSLWDTYRTLHPFITLLYPRDARDFAVSLTRMGQEGGAVPRWPLATGETEGMCGDGGTIALADTWLRGVRDWDVRAAYAVMRRQATTEKPPGQRPGRELIGDYMSLGYVPKDSGGRSAAITLEYAHADHALGELARDLGENADADLFLGRGKNWRNVYDDTRHVFAGRWRDGHFEVDLPTAMSEDFAEGSAWHYGFMVPHDIEGVAARMGRDRALARAEQLFTRAACKSSIPGLPNPYYWPANEPVLFSGWVFAALGDRDRTARWTRWTTLTHFGDGPDGLPGNDDGGTMSAFYLFAALGLYPVAGTDRWILGSPLFPRATLALAGGPLTIEAEDASKKTRFPREITRNGAAVGSSVVRHADLAGATFRYVLDRAPR